MKNTMSFAVNYIAVFKATDLPDAIRVLAKFAETAPYRSVGECLKQFSNEFIDRVATAHPMNLTEESASHLILVGSIMNQAEGNLMSDMGRPEDLVSTTIGLLCYEYMSRKGLCTIDYDKVSMLDDPSKNVKITDAGKAYLHESIKKVLGELAKEPKPASNNTEENKSEGSTGV